MTVEFSQGALQGAGVTGDISRRGMFVRSNLAPGTGPVVRLTVNLPGGRKLALTGRVVRNVESAPTARTAPGFGLRLVDDWPEYDEIFGRPAHPAQEVASNLSVRRSYEPRGNSSRSVSHEKRA